MNRPPRLLPLACALTLSMLAGCAHHAQQPSAPPSPTASVAPGSTPQPYSYIYTPITPNGIGLDPNAALIREVDLNDRILVAPGPLRVRVLTNPAVISVVAHTMGHEIAIPQEASGVFGADDELPSVPFFLHHRTYDVVFTAAAPDGRTAAVTLPVTLR